MPLILTIVAALTLRWAALRHLGLGDVSIRGEKLFVAVLVTVAALPLAARITILARLVLPTWIAVMCLLLSMCLLNRSTHGFSVMALGVLLNLVVIVANGAMPVLASSVVAAGGSSAQMTELDSFHTAVTHVTRLLLLADVLPVPGPSGVRTILSVGDVLMLVGVLIVVASAPHPARSCGKTSLSHSYRQRPRG